MSAASFSKGWRASLHPANTARTISNQVIFFIPILILLAKLRHLNQTDKQLFSKNMLEGVTIYHYFVGNTIGIFF